eukprot:GFUD01104783.1.p1 GENE.GFUD01104783.1~~GFUD01104783.1.p1  ORF type:complete len:194 (-),score=16.19 GFUD01104783.1:338-919(-)
MKLLLLLCSIYPPTTAVFSNQGPPFYVVSSKAVLRQNLVGLYCRREETTRYWSSYRKQTGDMFLYLRAGQWHFFKIMGEWDKEVMKEYRDNYPHLYHHLWRDITVKESWNYNNGYQKECAKSEYVVHEETFSTPTSTLTSTSTTTAEKKESFVPIYIGGSIALIILFIGFILCFIFVQYPNSKISDWFGSFLK